MVSKDELITLNQAMDTYGHTRAWWYAQVAAGLLTFYDIPGDRNNYLLLADVETLLEPKPRPRPEQKADESAG